MQALDKTRKRIGTLCVLILSFVVFSLTAGTNFMPAPINGAWQPKEIIQPVNQGIIAATLSLTPTQDLQQLSVNLKKVKCIKVVSGKLSYQFTDLKANVPITIKIKLSVLCSDESNLIASVIIADTSSFRMGKAFILLINPKPVKPSNQPIIEDVNGQKLIIY